MSIPENANWKKKYIYNSCVTETIILQVLSSGNEKGKSTYIYIYIKIHTHTFIQCIAHFFVLQ